MVLWGNGESTGCFCSSCHVLINESLHRSQVTNVLLRFSWVIYLFPGPASNLTKIFIIAFLEMLRRFQWNFFRLETEHLGNADPYRVIKDVPLPYRLAASLSEGEEDIEPKSSSLRLATLRRHFTNGKVPDELRESDFDSSDGGADRSAISRAKAMGSKLAQKLAPTIDGHMNDPAQREYTSRRAEQIIDLEDDSD